MFLRIPFLIFFFSTSMLFGQTILDFHLEPLEIPELGGVQSFGYGTHEGEWLIVGGRLDGLHRRQPWASFDEAGNNDQLIVVNPSSSETWSASLDVLPTSIREKLAPLHLFATYIDAFGWFKRIQSSESPFLLRLFYFPCGEFFVIVDVSKVVDDESPEFAGGEYDSKKNQIAILFFI